MNILFKSNAKFKKRDNKIVTTSGQIIVNMQEDIRLNLNKTFNSVNEFKYSICLKKYKIFKFINLASLNKTVDKY